MLTRVVVRSKRLVLVLGVFALIPGLAATGLSLPLPAAVERIAAALVPWAEAATLADQPVERSAVGSIVLTSAERDSGVTAPLTTGSATSGAQSQDRPKPKKLRGTAHKPMTGARKGAAPTAGDAPASNARGQAKPHQSAAEPSDSTPILASSEPPRSNAGAQPQPTTAPEPKTDPSPQPKSDPATHSPTPQPSPIQQTVDQTVETVVTTTQTVVTTVPILEPVVGLISNPGGVVGGGLLPGSGSNSGSGSSNSGSGSSNSGSGNSGSGSSNSGSGSGSGSGSSSGPGP